MSGDFNDMKVFAAVAEHRSLVLASKGLGLTPSGVSKVITRLEQKLQVRLLQRNTRHLTLTEAGITYHQWCGRILQDVQSAHQALEMAQTTASGWLKMCAPEGLGRWRIAPLIGGLLQEHPDLQLDLRLDDQGVDPLQTGADLVVRLGPLKDSDMIARKLGSIPSVLVASPSYLQHAPQPLHPKDLSQHRVLICLAQCSGGDWMLSSDEETYCGKGHVAFMSNCVQATFQAACTGAGIALLPWYAVEEAIAQKYLTPILPSWQGPLQDVFALYCGGRLLPIKVRMVLDYLVRHFQTHPLSLPKDYEEVLGATL